MFLIQYLGSSLTLKCNLNRSGHRLQERYFFVSLNNFQKADDITFELDLSKFVKRAGLSDKIRKIAKE